MRAVLYAMAARLREVTPVSTASVPLAGRSGARGKRGFAGGWTVAVAMS